MSKYDELTNLDDIYKTIENEVENKELAEFIIKEIKSERKLSETMVNYNENLRLQVKQLQMQNKIINSFTNNELIDELSKRLGDKNE